MLEISSSQNNLFREFMSLTESKGLKKSDKFLISGENLVKEFANQYPGQILSEIFCEGQSPSQSPKLRVKLSKELFQQLDVLGTHWPLLVASQKKIPTLDFGQLGDGLHLMLPLGDPANLGAALRSAAGFSVESVILLQESANIYLPKAIKSAAGATFKLNLFKGPSVSDLKKLSLKDLRSGTLIALDSQGEALQNFKWPKKNFLLVGEEGAGIPDIEFMKTLSIKTQQIESLNATVALSIALYSYSLKMEESGKS